MKTVKSYSLSEKAIAEVKRVKTEKGYKSESDALEAIILNKETNEEFVRRIVADFLSTHQAATIENKTPESSPVEKDMKDEVEEAIKASMKDIFNNM